MEKKNIIGLIGLIASIIAIVTFFTGAQYFGQLLEFLGIVKSSKEQKSNVERSKITELPKPPCKLKTRVEHKQPIVKRHGVSVMVTKNKQSIYWDLTYKITSVIKKSGGDVVNSSGLDNRFVSSGQFAQVFNGAPVDVRRLGAGIRAAYLILGNQSMSYRQNSDFDGLVTADATIELLIVSSINGTVVDSFSISNSGAGYTKADAEKVAIKNIMKTITTRLKEIAQLNLD